MKKFADDTKLGQVVNNQDGIKKLQDSLDNLEEWEALWGMSFNVSKCKILYMGRNNISHQYKIGNSHVPNDQLERDIGVILMDNLKPSK